MPGPGELCWYVNVPPPAAPPGFRPGFCPLQVCISRLSQPKKKWIPHGLTAQNPLLLPIVYRPPRGGGARSGIPPCSSGRSSLYLFYFSYKLCIASGYTPPFPLCIYPIGLPAISLSVSTAVHSLQCESWLGLTSSLPFPFPIKIPMILRSPGLRRVALASPDS